MGIVNSEVTKVSVSRFGGEGESEGLIVGDLLISELNQVSASLVDEFKLSFKILKQILVTEVDGQLEISEQISF